MDTTTVSPIPPQDSLSILLDRIAAALAPVQSHLNEMELALRADSGTVRADSVFLRYHGSLETITRVAVQQFDDRELQNHIWSAWGRGARMRGATARGQRLDSFDAEVADSLANFLLNRGIWSYMAEGDTYFDISESYLHQRFGRFVTDATTDWLTITSREQLRPTGGDGSLMIHLDELAERWAAVDRYLAEHPDAPAGPLARERNTWYLRPYLNGWPNTEVFDRGTGALVPGRRESYERFVARHPDTPNGRIVAEYLDVLAASGYRRTPAVVAFLRRYLDYVPDAR